MDIEMNEYILWLIEEHRTPDKASSGTVSP